MSLTDVNPRLGVDVIHVAQLFSASNLDALDRPRADEILQLLRAGSFGEAKLKCDEFARPEFGSSPAYFARKQFTALVAKVPFTGDNARRKRRARDSFLESEARCRRINRKLRFYSEHNDRIPTITRIALSRAREEIRRLLGPLTDHALQRVISEARPGSGVAIGTWNRFRVSTPFKLGATDLAVTREALPYAAMMVEGSPSWLRLHLECDFEERTYHVPYVVANRSRMTYVPKDARTMRTIAIEPALNVCLQLGVHSQFSRKLASVGNDIVDQSRNQALACSGSTLPLGASIATLDLSQASDSVSTELVRWLLPWDWFALLSDLRCTSTEVPGEGPLELEKFSSMGNGFTFCLETLIFWAIGRAVNSLTGGEVLSVYGDDIVISDNSALLLTEVLEWAGFRINSDKSFYLGHFRESCGADWHYGRRVTPQYIRTPVLRCTDVYSFLNRVDPMFCIGPVRDYLLAEHRKIRKVLFGLPYEDTSGCLFAPFDYVKGCGFLRWNSRFMSWTFRVIRFVSESPKTPDDWAYAAALRGGRGSAYALRGRGTFRTYAVTPGVIRDVPRF